jgi:V8-like Glu-specific endopeptidase
MKAIALCVMLTFLGTGCAEPSDDSEEPEDVLVSAIVGDNNHADEASEVGQLRLGDGKKCSATLIGTHTILTAAHCFKYKSRSDRSPSGHTFGRVGSNGVGYTRNILRFQSLGKAVGRDDLAVAELDSDVDQWTATSDIWDIEPWTGGPAALFGFGCSTPTWNSTSHKWKCASDAYGTMHVATTTWTGALTLPSPAGDMAPMIAHGDSGGPVFTGGRIVAVISAMSSSYRSSDGALVSTEAMVAAVVRNKDFIQKWRTTFGN